MLIDAIPGFEFPRHNLYDYVITTEIKDEDKVLTSDFILGLLWDEMLNENLDEIPRVIVEQSYFTANLTSEEINILAILMMCSWVQRQVTSIENTRMKYSGTDFKMTSQANHLAKLLTLLKETQRQSLHMQRLYKRRRTGEDGEIKSNWDVFREDSVIAGHVDIDENDMYNETVKDVILEGGII